MQYLCFGGFSREKAGHEESYYTQRYTFLDLRGPVRISPLSYFGFGVRVISLSHDISTGQFSQKTVPRPVVVEDYAWITTGALLYNCHISHHAIVAVGAVVSGITVPPYTIVAGNPARPVARWDGQQWIELCAS